MKESIFEIKYIAKKEAEKTETKIHEGYNLRCLFQNQKETKTYSEILNLQQLASLCQNKEKKEELQYLNNYIELIENLKDILNIISIITNKGCPNYFEYNIIVNENIICKDSSNNISMTIIELKNSLKQLLNEMNELQIEYYKENNYIRFFYGRQITKINDYLREAIGLNNNEKQISHLIKHILGDNFKKKPDYIYQSIIPSNYNVSDSSNERNVLNEINDNFYKNIMKEMYKNTEEYISKIVEINGLS